jgi:transposase-like protein
LRVSEEEEMETGVEVPVAAPETEVSAKAQRRRFTAEYKRRILKEADRCLRPGEIGVLLRREGLYSSALTTWRAARERGGMAGLAPKKRGRRAQRVDPLARKIALQEREIAQWKARAQRAEALVEIQKKFSEMVGVPLPENGGKR